MWTTSLLAEAEAQLSSASRAGPTGRYQLEAAIQSAHVARRVSGLDTWPSIIALYDILLRLTGSPVVRLNRAVALAERDGPEVALAELAALAADRRMTGYQPYFAALGHLSARAGRRAEARDALTMAIGLATDTAARAWLAEALAALPRD